MRDYLLRNNLYSALAEFTIAEHLASEIDSAPIAEDLAATNFTGTVVIVSEKRFGQAVLEGS